MRKRSNLLLYLLLNVIVSAATTLAVLWLWDNVWGTPRGNGGPNAPQVLAQNTSLPVVSAGQPTASPTGAASGAAVTAQTAPAAAAANAAATAASTPLETAGPTETPLPADAKLIEVVSVVGAGDLQQEVVLLRRVGEGNLRMVGWKLVGENKNTYTFPEQPELILYKDGAVQVYTGAGTDTVTEVYWNRSEAAWRSGELVRLLDPQGNERATFRVP